MKSPFRADLRMEGGQVRAVEPKNSADTVKPLPKVEGTDRLQSDAWGAGWKAEAGGDMAVAALADAQANISRTYNSFKELREQRNPEVTQAAHLNGLAKDFERSLKRAAAQSDSAQTRAKERLAAIESDFRERVKWNGADAQELRGAIRGMSEKERDKLLTNAVNEGDGQVLAAVLGGHPSLSGIAADRHKAMRLQAMHKHAPDLAKVEKVVTKAMEITRQSFIDLLEREDAITASSVREQYDKAARDAAELRKRAAGDDADRFGAW